MQVSRDWIAFERRKRQIFEAVRGLNEEQQTRALSDYAETEPELANAVRDLLSADRPDSDGILSNPPYQRPAGSTAHPKSIGKYAVERHLGAGGMGSIYGCREPESGALVAVKIIRSDLQSRAARDHFKRERDILMRVNHPNICRILDANIADVGTPFIVMQFVDGKPMDQYCRDHRCNVDKRLLLFSQVLAGIDYLHSQNIVHRDLKPSNLLVTASGSVRILDFGIAKMVEHAKGLTGSDQTATKTAVMTLAYASPEQLIGRLSGRASDIYSLGVLCYELLTGQLPSPSEFRKNPQTLHRALSAAPPLPPSRVCAHTDIRPSMDNLVMNALEFHPEARYASVGLFLSDVRRCLEGGTVPRRRAGYAANTGI